ncbi:MAG: FtsQ-type POTRA domain-containing protein [Aliifodinibius sp.]|nr:FtsQ-type POTRA domain-containing protein [candidate division KSB1 bacterium]NIT60284.1 FtsQ-type POTRA domain-containing protein [Fodinibius sp.]NIV15020.1 FtsQ-type POTRA domain-containing protein [Fodinibius sp.]NIY28866.1 FtsQ-type POTRA domain-containing protein [Fodinibius sp.]
MTKNEQHTESPKNSNAWPWIAGAIFVLGLAIMAGLYWNSTMKVQSVQFEGNHFVSTQDLQLVEVPTGMNPDSMNFGEIRNRFEELPYVKQADISVSPNGTINIQVTERQPVALLIDNKKKIYVDNDGIKLPIVSGKTVDVPILYGFSTTPMQDTLQSKGFQIASDFLTAVRSNEVADATISEIAWSSSNEGIVALTNQNGVKLIFGKGDFSTRLRNWEAFYGNVIKQKGIEKMRSVDLRFEGQIVTREH